MCVSVSGQKNIVLEVYYDESSMVGTWSGLG